LSINSGTGLARPQCFRKSGLAMVRTSMYWILLTIVSFTAIRRTLKVITKFCPIALRVISKGLGILSTRTMKMKNAIGLRSEPKKKQQRLKSGMSSGLPCRYRKIWELKSEIVPFLAIARGQGVEYGKVLALKL